MIHWRKQNEKMYPIRNRGSRCYVGGEGRTKMKSLKAGKIDYITVVLCVVLLAVFILLNILLPRIVR